MPRLSPKELQEAKRARQEERQAMARKRSEEKEQAAFPTYYYGIGQTATSIGDHTFNYTEKRHPDRARGHSQQDLTRLNRVKLPFAHNDTGGTLNNTRR